MNKHFLSLLEKARQGLAGNDAPQVSDREFSVALGLNPSAINQWRKKGKFPTDQTMMKLADLAGIDRWQALMLLNYLRATNDDVKQAYYEMYRKGKSFVSHAILALLTSIALAFSNINTAKAAAYSGHQPIEIERKEVNISETRYIHYHTFRYRSGYKLLQFAVQFAGPAAFRLQRFFW